MSVPQWCATRGKARTGSNEPARPPTYPPPKPTPLMFLRFGSVGTNGSLACLLVASPGIPDSPGPGAVLVQWRPRACQRGFLFRRIARRARVLEWERCARVIVILRKQ
jgi:hypothetical protein